MPETAPLVSSSNTEIFYPVTDDMPRLGIRVVVVWGGREFLAGRNRDKKTGAIHWVTYDESRGDRRLIYLPPEGEAERWGHEPNCWRPEKPELWQAPLPPPLLSTEPRFVDVRGDSASRSRPSRANKYSAMSAQAEQSARTQAELVAEFGEIDDPSTADKPDKLWWLSERLTYSPKGSISEREAEGRVARAILTDGIRPGDYGGPGPLRETSSALSQFIHETLLSTDAEHLFARFEPTPRDLSDYVTAFGWFSELNPPHMRHPGSRVWEINHPQSVLVWRITGSSWRELASLAGGSHMGAKKAYGRIIGEVTAIANGLAVPTRRAMTALRERNRKARVEG